MAKIKLQPKRNFGRKDGCRRCGRKRGMVRRYGLRLCRQCFRDSAPALGFRKYS
ncbi:MAG: 30S ribosomal protein S14 [Thermoplasmataceae archaeon]